MAINWEKIAKKLQKKFGDSWVHPHCDKENPYNYWLKDVSAKDLVKFFASQNLQAPSFEDKIIANFGLSEDKDCKLQDLTVEDVIMFAAQIFY